MRESIAFAGRCWPKWAMPKSSRQLSPPPIYSCSRTRNPSPICSPTPVKVQVADGKMITALERIAPGWGGDEGKPLEEGFFIWDVEQPAKPKRLGHYRTHSTGTHRNFYDGGVFVHAAGGAPGYDGKVYHIVDISDPSNPKPVSLFALEGQRDDAPKSGAKFSLHGPAHIEGARAYLSYGDAGGLILDVSDFNNPRMVSQLAFQGLLSRHFSPTRASASTATCRRRAAVTLLYMSGSSTFSSALVRDSRLKF